MIGADVFPGGNNFQRAIGAEQARQTHGTAEAGHNAELGFRQPNAQIRRRRAVIGRQHTFATAAQRIAIDGRDSGDGEIFQTIEDAVSKMQPLA